MDIGIGKSTPSGHFSLVPEREFLAVSALLFIASVGGTVYLLNSLSAGMAMPGQVRLSAAVLFVAMWVVMMAAMMLPSLIPTLVRYRRSVRSQGRAHAGGHTLAAGAGYFLVWAAFGAAAYLLSLGVGAAEMQWMDLAGFAPVAAAAVVLLAGGFQLSRWKAGQLGCCREPRGSLSLAPEPSGAWQYGIHLGLHCALCCAGFMAVLLVTGMTNLGIMALLAAAITLERLAPKPELVAHLAGVAMVGGGGLMMARALGVI